ncbi:MAG: FumA C-terminus/TtdB family hydratase beta subunit [Candidatus Cloacimonadaceae bacterium]|nr:FumA C-terminus/TtdB family hydratase beta subunit [Candidatus Cloacimonadaceae bacterium]
MHTFSLKLPYTAQSFQDSAPALMDKVLLSGYIYTARDLAHRRMLEILARGETLPFDLSVTALYYCGPSPVPPGKICGAIGPTTSSRMDVHTPMLLQHGLKIMIGKGDRDSSVMNMLKDYEAMYLVTIGGAAALLSQHVKSCEVFCWPELGTEAVFKLEVIDFPTYIRNL